MNIVVKIGRAADGSFGGNLDIPDQAAKDLPINSVVFDPPDAVFTWTFLGMEFKGELSDDATRLAGKWDARGILTDVTLDRVETLEEESYEGLSYDPPTDHPDIRGYWEGVLEVQGTRLRLALAIGRAEDGTFKGTMDSPDQGATGIPISEIGFDEPAVSLKWPALSATFIGDLVEGGTVMKGKFKQGIEFDMAFERRDKPATE